MCHPPPAAAAPLGGLRVAAAGASAGGGAPGPARAGDETEEALVLEAKRLGVSTEDIDIELHDHRLTLRGERKRQTEVKEEQYRWRGRLYGLFEHSFLLPTMVDQAKVTANFKNGVLELRLPKSEAAKPKRIAITEAEGAAAGRWQMHPVIL